MKELYWDTWNWSSPSAMYSWRDLSQRSESSISHQKLVEFLRQTVIWGARRVLDIWCWNGRFIPVLTSNSEGYYMWVDNSALLLDAWKRYPYIKGRHEYFQRDITSWFEFLKDRKFDFIVMLFCLHFIDQFQILPLFDGLNERLDIGWKMIVAWYLDNPTLTEYTSNCMKDLLSQVTEIKAGWYIILEGVK